MFNRHVSGFPQYGIYTGTHFRCFVHDHKVSAIFYDKRWFDIFYWEHPVIIAMNVEDIRMLPIVLPVKRCIYRPVDIFNIHSPPVISSYFFVLF